MPHYLSIALSSADSRYTLSIGFRPLECRPSWVILSVSMVTCQASPAGILPRGMISSVSTFMLRAPSCRHGFSLPLGLCFSRLGLGGRPG